MFHILSLLREGMASKKTTQKIEDEEIVIDVEEEEPGIEDLLGVGPATAEKLREADSMNS